MELQNHLLAHRVAPKSVVRNRRRIYRETLQSSGHIATGNFESIHPSDLERMFDLYDGVCFQGRCRQSLGNAPLRFRISRRMTSAGGKTTATYLRRINGQRRREYRIRILRRHLRTRLGARPEGLHRLSTRHHPWRGDRLLAGEPL